MKPIEILKKAQEGKYAIGQFNISTDEQIRAVIEAAKDLKSPVIIGTSESEREFIGTKQAVALVETWKKETGLPIILNADHCKGFESAKEAVNAGYDMIQFDGSGLSFEDNIKDTKQVVEYTRSKNPEIIIEAELGYLRGSSEIHKEKIEIKEEDLTRPDEAREFVEKTRIDSLAIVIGNTHGIEIGEEPPLFLDRLKEIQRVVPNTFLVLHGGSKTPEKDIKGAIELGIVKININTELRIAYSDALEKEIKAHPDEIKPYKILAPAVEEMKKVVAEKIKLFGSQGKI
ncbi:MAG: tagatose-bisphosphate aldolase [Candidatus Portnoybacteria bacterium CG10_big_fil_rev_8_21_14_0_10_38_18]|uniref:Tagatose-bisphosphate aldolase n=1 Tax=Candidatus Portnoybacteria bacterium CG10_big_fil_rev_8_21_14_0_10_38_18 TaxID=1974813 RepID=A0A2M8KC85_9BACT|nr:MAG: tagatose-bisphosphate aldolase [Candidatus Portnoybacteria bacterium CG10_big_fil_rev_8_21_14_0_10_38_18]